MKSFLEVCDRPMPPTVTTADPNHRTRVMVIDDDPQIRNLLVAFLRRDYLVSVASEGLEGYTKALEHTPDIAVIDIQMPGWDGLKTLIAFREHEVLKQVRIVMLTADASRQTVMAAIGYGADDYIVKTTLSKADLLQKLQRVRHRRPSSSAAPASTPLNQAAGSQLPAEPECTLPIGVGDDLERSAQPTASPQVRHTPELARAGVNTQVDPLKLQELLDAWE